MWNRLRTIEEALVHIDAGRLHKIEEMVHRIEAALVVRDPGTARSVEAYEGLRKTIAGSMRERRQHLVQLVQMSDALDRGASLESMRDLVDEWCELAGLARWDNPEPRGFFRAVEGEGDELEVISPAWVDVSDPQAPVLIQQGAARLTERGDEVAEEDGGGTETQAEAVVHVSQPPPQAGRTEEDMTHAEEQVVGDSSQDSREMPGMDRDGEVTSAAESGEGSR